MLGSNPSADSVASTDTRGMLWRPPFAIWPVKLHIGRGTKRQILGVWGQSPHKHLLPMQTALSRAPSHNA